MQPEPKINPKSVGCPYCTAGHAPSWQASPAPGEWVHVVRKKVDDKTVHYTHVACTAANVGKSNG